MPTTFDLFSLGLAPIIDTFEGNLTSEGHNNLNGLVFGSALNPLASTVTSLSPSTDFFNNYTGGPTANAYDADNLFNNERFIIDGVTLTHDATMRYTNSVITYTDGTTAIVDAIVMQDTNGNLYLLPPASGPDAYSDALEAKPILTLTLGTAAPANGTDVYAMTADRYDLTLPDYMVEGTAGNDLIDAAYLGDPEGDRIDDTDNLAGTNDDLVFAGAGDDTVRAGAGNDTVYGEDGNDLLDGGAGNDLLHGGLGDDTMIGGAGADTFHGNVGLDIVDYSGSSSAVNVDLSTGSFSGGDAEGDTGTGLDGMVGSDFNDTLIGYDGVYDGGLTTNVIDGGAGDDFIDGRDGGDTLLGGAGNDTILGGGGNDLIDGGDGNDWLDGGDGTDTVFGGAGNDTILVAGDNDSIFGGDDADLIHATALNLSGIRNFSVDGGSGGIDNDTLDLSELIADGWVISNMTQNPESNGNPGFSGQIQLTRGFEGATINYTDIENFILTNSDYIVEGTAGADLIDASYTGDPQGDKIDNLDHSDGSNADLVLAGAGDDTVFAGAGDDTILGDDGNDQLFGMQGRDSIDGGAGNDILDGGIEADTLIGGAGNDTINVSQGDSAVGGDGDDFFVLTDTGEIATDTITIVGGEGGEIAGDTLWLGPDARKSDITFSNPDDLAGGLSGSFTLTNGTVVNFSEIENIICFTPGARILTQWGERPVETLRLGDLVVTRDHGLQPIRWIGKRTVRALGDFAPISVASGVTGGREPLLVSPQHRLLFTGYQAELLFGEREVLIAAKHLVNDHDVIVSPQDEVTYIHIMFHRHEIIYADGIGTESFYAGDTALSAVQASAREELFSIFPELRSAPGQHRDTARTCLRRHEARLLHATEDKDKEVA